MTNDAGKGGGLGNVQVLPTQENEVTEEEAHEDENQEQPEKE